MTRVTLSFSGERATGISVEGHSGYAPEGSDIVCAAITAAVRLVETTLNDVMKLSAEVEVEPDTALITVRSVRPEADPIFRGFGELIKQLVLEYPDYIELHLKGR